MIPRRSVPPWAGALLLGWGLLGPHAAADDTTSWIALAQLDLVESSDYGGRLELDWLRRRPSGSTLAVGGEAFQLGNVSWIAGRVAGSVAVSPGTTLTGRAVAGTGEEDGDDIPVLDLRIGITQRWGSRPVWLSLEEQFVEVSQARGHLLKATLLVLARERHQVALSLGASVAGNLDTEYATLRWDEILATGGVLAGVSAGRIRPELAGSFGPRQSAEFVEAFVGLTRPSARGRTFTWVLSHREGDVARRSSLAIVARIPTRDPGGKP